MGVGARVPVGPIHATRVARGELALRRLWAVDAAMTAWEGVRFGEAGSADAGRVVKLYHVSTGLTGVVPAVIGRLTALTGLYLNITS